MQIWTGKARLSRDEQAQHLRESRARKTFHGSWAIVIGPIAPKLGFAAPQRKNASPCLFGWRMEGGDTGLCFPSANSA